MPDIMKMGKNPNYLGSWDLEDLPGRELTVTIKKIVDEEVVNNGKKEGCTVCYFTEEYKPMILNITNKKTLCKLYKTKETAKLVGKRFTIRIEEVKAFGSIHDALRIKPVVPAEIRKDIKCEKCGKNILPFSGMNSEQLAEYTKSKYGHALCSDCATKAAEGGA